MGNAASELWDAAGNGDLSRVRGILDKQEVDVHAVNKFGKTALHLAAMGHVQVAEFLIERGARVDFTDEDGSTPLHCACGSSFTDIESSSSCLQIVQLLIKHGANVNAITKSGYTPLHCASQAGHLEVVKVLLERGARFDAKDDNDTTPLMLAREKNHASVLSFLEEAEKNDISHPSMWAISYQQLMDVHQEAHARFGAEYKNMTMHDVSKRIIAPLCQKEGTSYALHLNPEGLKVDAFITHAWDEPFEQFIESIVRVFEGWAMKPNLWICSFALMQGNTRAIEEELDVPLDQAPFVRALQEATSFVVVRNEKTDVYSRIWCVCELMYAKKFGLLIPGKTHVTGPDAKSKERTSCMDAKATHPEDRDKIIKVLLNEHSREEVDKFINQFRGHPWSAQSSTATDPDRDRTSGSEQEMSPERDVIDAYFAMQCQPSTLLNNLDGRPQLLSDLHGIHKFISEECYDNPDSTRGFEDLFKRDYQLHLTDGSRKHVEEALESSHVRIFFWCSRGVDECSESLDHMSVDVFDTSDTRPEVVIVCMEFGAHYVAKQIYHGKNVSNVFWVRLNPYDKDITDLFTQVFLPFCASLLPGRHGFKFCAEELERRLKEFKPFNRYGFYCRDDDGQKSSYKASASTKLPKLLARGERLKPVKQISSCSIISLFGDRRLKQLKVNRGDLEKLEELRNELSPGDEGGPLYIYLKCPFQLKDGEHMGKACQRSKALALYTCCHIASKIPAGEFHNGVIRVSTEEEKQKTESMLKGKSRSALIWIDFVETAGEPSPFSDLDGLERWISSLGQSIDLVILLTSDSDSSNKVESMVEQLVYLGESVDCIELDEKPRGPDIPVDSLVGKFSINALSNGARGGEEVCLLDRVEAQVLADVLNDTVFAASTSVESAHGHIDGMFDRSLYRDDDGSVKVRFFINDVKCLMMLRDRILLGRAAEQLNKLLPQGDGHIQVDRTSMAMVFDSMVLQLETLTPHQQRQLKECEELLSTRKRLIIRGAAGTGKTFVVLHHVLECLEKNKDGNVLYVCRNKALGLYFCRWLCHRLRQVKQINRALRRIFVLSGQEPNKFFHVALDERKGILCQKPSSSGRLIFHKVIIDEAHDVFGDNLEEHDPELKSATVALLRKQNDYELILLSDDAQASVPNIEQRYPSVDDWASVHLSEVCRSTKRILLGARCFQLGNLEVADTVHGSDGLPLRAVLFDKPEREGRRYELYAEKICHMIQDILEKLQGLDLHGRLAIVVPNNSFRVALCREGGLSELLHSKKREIGQTLVLVDAAQAAAEVNIGHQQQNESRIVIDSVAQMAGLEYLVVFGVGLDETLSGGAGSRLICSRIYRTITRAQLVFYLINEKVKGGWFEWLERIKNEDNKEEVSLSEELSKLSRNAALLLVKQQEEMPLSLPKHDTVDANELSMAEKRRADMLNAGSTADLSNADARSNKSMTFEEDLNVAEDTQLSSNIWDTSEINSTSSGNLAFQPIMDYLIGDQTAQSTATNNNNGTPPPHNHYQSSNTGIRVASNAGKSSTTVTKTDAAVPRSIIDMVLQLERATMEKNVEDALDAIRNATYGSSNDESNRVDLTKAGGIYVILLAMKRHAHSKNVQWRAFDALTNLAYWNADNQVAIAQAGSVEAIVGAMKRHAASEIVQSNACGALCNLAIDDNIQVAIVQAGGVEAIVEAMKRHAASENVQYRACGALYSLSDSPVAMKRIRKENPRRVLEAAASRYPNSWAKYVLNKL